MHFRQQLVKVCTSGGDPLSHGCNDSIIVHLPSARTDGSQKESDPDYMVGVVGQSSQTLQRAPWSSNLYGAWRCRVAGERLSCSSLGSRKSRRITPFLFCFLYCGPT
jgi:hypothetical protein